MERRLRVLTLDVGNTTVDACSFDGDSLHFLGKFKHHQIGELRGDWERVYVSSVKPSCDGLVRQSFPSAEFISPEEIPIRTHGVDKGRMGVDRLLNLYGAMEFYSDSFLLLSCGTAFVLDVMVEGVFLGGYITLGLSQRLRCLHERAELLPLFDLERMNVFLGKDTKSAMVGGVLKEAQAFVERVRDEVQRVYGKSLKVVITGGDGWALEDLGVFDGLLIHKAILRLKSFL